MQLNDILNAVAAYFDGDREGTPYNPDSFIKNETDLGLVAINQVRMNAELSNDFNFTRKLLQLNVDGVTGGSLDDAVLYGATTSCKAEIKTIVDVGQFDTDGNFIPVDWTTTGDSLNIQRQDNANSIVRYPTDGEAISVPCGGRRFRFTGNRVYAFPKAANTTFTIGIEAYTFTRDWTDNSENPTDENSKIWLSKGAQYLQWQTIIHLNHLYKQFVFRQEGNLPPPKELADSALATLMTWDSFKYEQFRRHDGR